MGVTENNMCTEAVKMFCEWNRRFGYLSHDVLVTLRVQSQVDEVIDVMQENISKVIERGERLDELQDKSGKKDTIHLMDGNLSISRCEWILGRCIANIINVLNNDRPKDVMNRIHVERLFCITRLI